MLQITYDKYGRCSVDGHQNVCLLTEQIQRCDVTQKLVTIVPDELFTLMAHSTTRLHIKKNR